MRNQIKLTIALALTICLCTTVAFAASGSWNVDADGSWTNPANWAGGIVASNGAAYFTNAISANTTVSIDADIVGIHRMDFFDAYFESNMWTLSDDGGVLTLSGSDPNYITSDASVSRLNIKCVLDGTEGFTVRGNGKVNIGFTSNLISGRVVIDTTADLTKDRGVVCNHPDAFMNADLNVKSLLNSRKYALNAKTIIVDKDLGRLNILETSPGYTAPVKVRAESITVTNGGLLGAGLFPYNPSGSSFDLLSPSINIDHGGKIIIQGNASLITIGGSNINVNGSGSVSNGGMFTVKIPLVTNTANLKVSGYAANNLGALRANSNCTLVVDASVELAGNTRFGGKGEIVLNENITGTGNLDLEVNGTDAEEFVCSMYGNNSYNGSTTIRAERGRISRLVLDSPNALPGNQPLIMHASNTASYSFYTTAKLNVRGQDATVESLRLTGDNQKMIYDYLAGWNGSLTIKDTMDVLAGYCILSNTVMVVNGNSDFHTNLYVHNAKLILNKSMSASLSPGATPIILKANSTIGGKGSCGYINIPGGSTVSPGESIGVLYPKDIEMEAGSLYDWEIGNTTAGESDEVKCGILALPAAANSITVHVLKTTGPTISADTNELFITTGILGGNAGSIFLDYSGSPGIDGPKNPFIDGNNIIITGLTPEPGCIGLFILSSLAWLRLKR